MIINYRYSVWNKTLLHDGNSSTCVNVKRPRISKYVAAGFNVTVGQEYMPGEMFFAMTVMMQGLNCNGSVAIYSVLDTLGCGNQRNIGSLGVELLSVHEMGDERRCTYKLPVECDASGMCLSSGVLVVNNPNDNPAEVCEIGLA